MLDPVKGVSFNVMKCSDGQLMLEWQAVDSAHRTQQFRTIHPDFDSLSKQMQQTLSRAGVL